MRIPLPDIAIGADWVLPVYWNDCDGNPIDATGFTAHMQIRLTLNSTQVLVDISTGNGIIAGNNPAFLLTIAKTITSALSPVESAVWDLFITNPSGLTLRFLGGIISIKESVTR